MNRFNAYVGILGMAILVIGISGCNTDSADKQPSLKGDDRSTAGTDKHGDHDHSSSDMKKMDEELAKLSPAEAASARKQHVCPVTGDMLGTMGPPKKVDVKGQQVWICCEGCREELLANPEKHLTKINKG